MNELVFQFSSSTAWQSRVIRAMCHSPFSHVDLVMADDQVCFGSSDPGGVKMRSKEYQDFRIRRQARIKTDLADRVIEIATTQLGKPFDDGALHSFLAEDIIPHRDWREPDKWFCSELWTWALERAGFFPYKLLVPKDRVSPADLLLLLTPWINPDEFWKPISGINKGPREL